MGDHPVNLLPCRNSLIGCPHTAKTKARRCYACHVWYYRHGMTERTQAVIVGANQRAMEEGAWRRQADEARRAGAFDRLEKGA